MTIKGDYMKTLLLLLILTSPLFAQEIVSQQNCEDVDSLALKPSEFCIGHIYEQNCKYDSEYLGECEPVDEDNQGYNQDYDQD